MAKRKKSKNKLDIAGLLIIVGAVLLLGLTATSFADLTGYVVAKKSIAPKLVLSPNPVLAGQEVTATISGFKEVAGKTVDVRYGGCGEGMDLYASGECKDDACNLKLTFNAPKATMIFPIYACIATGESSEGKYLTAKSAMANLDVRDMADLAVSSLTSQIKKGDAFVEVKSVKISDYGGKITLRPELKIKNIGTSAASLFDVTYSYYLLKDTTKKEELIKQDVTSRLKVAANGELVIALPTMNNLKETGTYRFKIYVDQPIPPTRRTDSKKGDFGDVYEFNENNNEAEVKLVVTS